MLRNLGDKAAWYLPESTVLEFLLNVNSPVLKTVEEYLQMYSDASPSAFWDGKNYMYWRTSSKQNVSCIPVDSRRLLRWIGIDFILYSASNVDIIFYDRLPVEIRAESVIS